MNDINTRTDVEQLVNVFYEKVRVNDKLGFIFMDIAKVDWELHLPKMYSFWASILLGEHSYTGNPMQTHIELNKMIPLTDNEFSEWLLLFNQTLDELFEGDKAEEAKLRALNIARLMSFKVQGK